MGDCPTRATTQRLAAMLEARAVAVQRSLRDGKPIGRIVVPRLHLSMVVVEGTSVSDLRRAPGHYDAGSGRHTGVPGNGRRRRNRRTPNDVSASVPAHRRPAPRRQHLSRDDVRNLPVHRLRAQSRGCRTTGRFSGTAGSRSWCSAHVIPSTRRRTAGSSSRVCRAKAPCSCALPRRDGRRQRPSVLPFL